jgi:hypothetical protein
MSKGFDWTSDKESVIVPQQHANRRKMLLQGHDNTGPCLSSNS